MSFQISIGKIPSTKLQITNNIQITITNDPNFCADVLVIENWDL
jgi:hypothetical protein